MIGDELLMACRGKRIAVVGSGGKTSLIFYIARNVPRAIITTTTHLSIKQSMQGDLHIDADLPFDNIVNNLKSDNQIFVLSSVSAENERVKGPGPFLLDKISEYCRLNNVTLLIESDGSRQLPLKAPANYEPCIPLWVDVVVVVAGLNGLFTTINDDHVHRSHIFCEIVGVTTGCVISEEHLIRYLKSPFGGLKNIPATAKRFLFLNQAETASKLLSGVTIAENLKREYDMICIGALFDKTGNIKWEQKNY